MEKQNKELFIKINLEKSEEAMRIAEYSICDKAFTTALNRIYYGMFYVVTALARKHEFITSKHSTLKGWFNKKFVNEDKIVEPALYRIYNTAFENRQESDYDDLYKSNEEFVKSLLSEAKKFIEQVSKII
ncbi:MAG: HEPN domain-containing protein [Heliobacteriaceae bacterium]|jgi:uncharacterized protein (UPF0332 family)|nr:HEPN domain-containing protein [Heliobacteriaceae bacterium]